MTSWQLPTGDMIIRERDCVTCRRTVLIFAKTGFVFASLRPVHIAHRSVWRIPEAYKVWTVDRYTDPAVWLSLSPWRVCKERAATFMLSLHLVLIVKLSVTPSEATDKEGRKKGEGTNAKARKERRCIQERERGLTHLLQPLISYWVLTSHIPTVLVQNFPLQPLCSCWKLTITLFYFHWNLSSYPFCSGGLG